MRAAQNPIKLLADLPTALPAGVSELIAALPPWLRAVLVVVLIVLIVTRLCLPPLLRAIDDHLLCRKACNKITESTDWIEVLRIRNEPRLLFGRGWAAESRPAISDGRREGRGLGAAGPAGRSEEQNDESADDPP